MNFVKCEFFTEDQKKIQEHITELAFTAPAADVYIVFKDSLKNDFIDGECSSIITKDLKKAYAKAAELYSNLERLTTEFAVLNGMVIPAYVYINIALCDFEDNEKEEVVVFSEGYQISA